MTKLQDHILYVAALLVFSGLAFAEDITRDGALELMGECQKQRQENIAPQREQAIEDCITRGLFWELPVCQQASAAEQFFRMNPSRQVYSSP
jgi:hypothetical protein